MVAHIHTVAFHGIQPLLIDVQVQLAPGLPAFAIVGLPDKAVAESRERVRASLNAIGLALPAKRITVNLSPADILKEGGHYDLPIALGVLCELEILDNETASSYLAMGELGLDGRLASISGALNAALAAAEHGLGLICPEVNGTEAALFGQEIDIIAAPDLLALIQHLKGEALIAPPKPDVINHTPDLLVDMNDIKGQESGKRALEVAAAGGHNLLMRGPPGAGKSMLAARLPTILPPLSPSEALEVSLIRSVAGFLLEEEGSVLLHHRPFRQPHHSASLPAIIGGGQRGKPGEISLAHNGVLFLDELPEFNRNALESLRQPLETNKVSIARVNAHVTYPARIQLVAAMNPCRCGHIDDENMACARAPKCGQDYQAKISGPLLDRFDLIMDIPAVSIDDLSLAQNAENSATVRERVMKARKVQSQRNGVIKGLMGGERPRLNAELGGDLLEKHIQLDKESRDLLNLAAARYRFSARGYHRILRLARTIADLAGHEQVLKKHLSEALAYKTI